jgi:hypothetical protein
MLITSLQTCLHTPLQEVKEKKRWGRLQKAKGDWCLLAGSPKDAFQHYKSAVELSKGAADAIWCVITVFEHVMTSWYCD